MKKLILILTVSCISMACYDDSECSGNQVCTNYDAYTPGVCVSADSYKKQGEGCERDFDCGIGRKCVWPRGRNFPGMCQSE